MSKVAGITDLSDELAAKRGISKSVASAIMSDVVEVMSDAIVNGGISLKGVMTIKPILRKGRTGKIAFGEKKGQEWKSEDKFTLSIKTGSSLEKMLNN